MTYLRQKKKEQKPILLDGLDYSILSYEQLLEVNGAIGSCSGGSYYVGGTSSSSSCGGGGYSSSSSSSSGAGSSISSSSNCSGGGSYYVGGTSSSSSCGGSGYSSSSSSSSGAGNSISSSSNCSGGGSYYEGGTSSSSSCGGSGYSSFSGSSSGTVSSISSSSNCNGGGNVSSGSSCSGGYISLNSPTTGSWGQMTNEDAINQKMQDYKDKNEKIDSSMNGTNNKFSLVGCKMEGAAKLLSEITNSKVDITDVNSDYDTNKDGLMTQAEISNAIKMNLKGGQTLTSDYFEKTLTKKTLDSISQQDGVTYVLGRAENVHGGQHWIVLEGYSINSYGQVEFDYNGTSVNDKGRKYILGTLTDTQKNNNYYTISKIETYTIR